MYEHKKRALASRKTYILRVVKSLIYSFVLIALCLFIGIWGYVYFEKMTILDGLLNASMILSGMGPVKTDLTDGGKYFASFYALFSGVIFITNMGIILAPVLHRMYHRLHIEDAQ